jgi:predicted transcriptional regulator
MGKKRSRTDIIGDMLDVIQNKHGSIKQTHLMYKSNLSYGQLTSYLEELVDKHFVEKMDRGSNVYVIITDKGSEFLQKFREMKQFERTFGL